MSSPHMTRMFRSPVEGFADDDLLALFADRSDVSEELTRLASHFAQFRALMTGGARSVGRELDFLLQEMHREVNTLGSKSADGEISAHVVAMKAELSRLREQVANVA